VIKAVPTEAHDIVIFTKDKEKKEKALEVIDKFQDVDLLNPLSMSLLASELMNLW